MDNCDTSAFPKTGVTNQTGITKLEYVATHILSGRISTGTIKETQIEEAVWAAKKLLGECNK